MYSATSPRPRPRSKMPRRIFYGLLTVVVLALAAVIGVRHFYQTNLQAVSGNTNTVYFTVKLGATPVGISTELEKDGLIRSSAAFQYYIRNKELRDKLQAGTYELRPNMDVPTIVTLMTEGRVTSKLVTILPGQRIDQVRTAFIKAGFNATAVDAALDPTRYKGAAALADKPVAANLEGFLYPNSYQKNDSTDPADIIQQSLSEMAEHLTPAVRSAFAKRGLTVYQGITLASIVEQEVSHEQDRAQASQVFLKRLGQKMPLGSDPTAFYGARLAGQTISVDTDTPYNTRIHEGLPPGPISNVSDSSLMAVANPATTDWLYFVAGDDGVTHFSKTLEEHEALTKKYCHKLCSETQ